MNENEVKEPILCELILISAEIEQPVNGTATVTFKSGMAEDILVHMCQTDSKSWELVKKLINDTISKIEELAT